MELGPKPWMNLLNRLFLYHFRFDLLVFISVILSSITNRHDAIRQRLIGAKALIMVTRITK